MSALPNIVRNVINTMKSPPFFLLATAVFVFFVSL